MPESTNSDFRSGQRQRILFVGDEPSTRNLVSTLMFTAGWACAVIGHIEEALAIIERESVDAVLLDVGSCDKPAEETIRKILESRPSLSGRILLICSGAADVHLMQLIARYRLLYISQDRLLQQLWTTLQDLLVPPPLRKTPGWSMKVAQKIFDSFRSPLTAGIRSLRPSDRHLAYQHESVTIDVSIQAWDGVGRIWLAGQVLDAKRKIANAGLSVVLISGQGTLAQTATNRSGEFHLEFDSVENAGLEIRLGERSWVSVPLEKMDWAGNPTANLQMDDDRVLQPGSSLHKANGK